MKLVVTGATGYIGSHLLSLALKKGHYVVAASRACPKFSTAHWVPFELSSTEPFKVPVDTQAIIHLASSAAPNEPSLYNSELLAAKMLIESSKIAEAKFIYISSQAARADAPTGYGRIKWDIEQEVLKSGGLIVRPGLVYGGIERGLFGIIAKLAKRLPILPVFMPAPKVQPIHVDDFSEGLLRIAERDDRTTGLVCLGSAKPISFHKFLAAIVSCRIRKRRLFIPVPIFLVKLTGLLLGQRLSDLSGISRLHSLFDLPLIETAEDLNSLGLSLRSMSSGMHPSGVHKRRLLLQEAFALLTYLLKQPPRSSLLRRYVNVVEQVRDGQPLFIPECTYRFPILLAFINPHVYCWNQRSAEYMWRINAAVVLAEATTQGAKSFLGVGSNQGFFISAFGISKALVSEVLCRILIFCCTPFLCFWFFKGKK